MPTYRAGWVLPIAHPPIRQGWVHTRAGRVVAAGGPGTPPPAAPGDLDRDLGGAAIMPGLVNAHTHLELSWLRGRVAPASNFVDWVKAQVRLRIKDPAPDPIVRQAAFDAIREMRASGTQAVGDVSNTLAVVDVLRDSGLAGFVFHEVLGFNAADPRALVADAERRLAALPTGPRLRAGLAPHAPYSVSPGLFAAVTASRGPRREVPTSVHIAESPEETELLATGTGRWREVLERMGTWNPAWEAPACGPVEYLDRLGFWDPRVLAVHGVQLRAAGLQVLAARGATLVACPRSNRHVGVGEPPVAAFYAAGGRVAVGTDSLASVEDLNLFAELAALRRLAPSVPARALLDSATRVGADALGLAGESGVIVPGARAALIAVDVPPGVTDVEEYLVGGIAPRQVAWVEE